LVRPAGSPADDLSGLLWLGERSVATWKGPRSDPVDVYLGVLDNKQDMVQVALVRAVPAADTRVAFDLTPDLLPSHSLRGRVVNERLEPLPQASLVAHRIDGNGLIVRRRAVAGADGTIAFGPLPPGDYEVRQAAGEPPRVLWHGLLTASRDEQLP